MLVRAAQSDKENHSEEIIIFLTQRSNFNGKILLMIPKGQESLGFRTVNLRACSLTKSALATSCGLWNEKTIGEFTVLTKTPKLNLLYILKKIEHFRMRFKYTFFGFQSILKRLARKLIPRSGFQFKRIKIFQWKWMGLL